MGISRIIILLLLCSVFGFAKKKDLGVGLQIAAGKHWESGGISVKKFISQTEAVDASLAYNEGAIGIDVDYLMHEYKLIPVTVGKFPLFYGVGGFVGHSENEGLYLGGRIPVGIAYEFKAPLDVFLKLTPTLRIFRSTVFEIQIALGGRYFF